MGVLYPVSHPLARPPHSQGTITAFFHNSPVSLAGSDQPAHHAGTFGKAGGSRTAGPPCACLEPVEFSAITHFRGGQGKEAGVILHISSLMAGLCLFLREIPFVSILGFWLPWSCLSSPVPTYASKEKKIKRRKNPNQQSSSGTEKI